MCGCGRFEIPPVPDTETIIVDSFRLKVRSTDTTDDYLANKLKAPDPEVDGISLELVNPGGNEYLKPVSRGMVRVSSNDSNLGYIEDKIIVHPDSVNYLEFDTVNDGANEQRRIKLIKHALPDGTAPGTFAVWDQGTSSWKDGGVYTEFDSGANSVRLATNLKVGPSDFGLFGQFVPQQSISYTSGSIDPSSPNTGDVPTNTVISNLRTELESLQTAFNDLVTVCKAYGLLAP